MAEKQTYRYHPEIFLQTDPNEARRVILVPEAGLTTEERWERETAWLTPLLHFSTMLPVVDYGCGIGRLSKLLTQAVIGVDISVTMRQLAEQYVRRTDFVTVSQVGFKILVDNGFRAGGALAAWSLQHVAQPAFDIELIARSLNQGALFWVLNRPHRAIPALNDADELKWIDDEIDVYPLIDRHFDLIKTINVPSSLALPGATLRCYLRRAP